jgi:hypothetical protein
MTAALPHDAAAVIEAYMSDTVHNAPSEPLTLAM